MAEELKHVTFNIGTENYGKLGNLATAKGVSIPEFVWNLVLEAIEDDEDARETIKAWDDKEGAITLEECIRQREKEGL